MGAQELRLPGSRTGSVAVVHRLSCFVARGLSPDQGSDQGSLALASGFFTTEPPGKPQLGTFLRNVPLYHLKNLFLKQYDTISDKLSYLVNLLLHPHLQLDLNQLKTVLQREILYCDQKLCSLCLWWEC